MLESDKVVVAHISFMRHCSAARADRAGGMAAQEPVQHVNGVDVVLDDQVAREVFPAVPCFNFLLLCGGTRSHLDSIGGATAFYEMRMRQPDRADRSRVDELFRLQIYLRIPALKTER